MSEETINNTNRVLEEFAKDEKDVRVPCNIWRVIKDFNITLSQIQNDITQLKADMQTLEGLIK